MEDFKGKCSAIFFEDVKNAVNFFKNIKPKFTSQMQFFTMVLESSLFVPDLQYEKINYWSIELERFNRFCKKHEPFIKYYKSEREDMDIFYFKQVDLSWQSPSPLPTYDKDLLFCSSHDQYIRGYLAENVP